MSVVQQRILESISVKQELLNSEEAKNQIVRIAESCSEALQDNGRIIFAGNGGSFADAQHLAAEFTSKLARDRAPLPSLALGTNSSTMSAIANDYGYEHIFERELSAILNSRDVFIAISTSGNSLNIRKAVEVAVARGAKTFALTGISGGRLISLCECLRVPSQDTARVQECHIMIGHILVELAESFLFAS